MVEYLSPEIADEGMAADDDLQSYMQAPKIPQYKDLISPKSKLAKYFPEISGRPYRHQPFPAWFYHPTKAPVLIADVYTNENPPRLIKSAVEEAKKLGCVWRKCTLEERAQGFPEHRWEYSGEWRATPFERETKFNPANPGVGKSLPAPTQSEVIGNAIALALAKGGQAASSIDQVGTIVAAVMAAMKTVNAPAAAGQLIETVAANPVAIPPVETTAANALAAEPPTKPKRGKAEAKSALDEAEDALAKAD